MKQELIKEWNSRQKKIKQIFKKEKSSVAIKLHKIITDFAKEEIKKKKNQRKKTYKTYKNPKASMSIESIESVIQKKRKDPYLKQLYTIYNKVKNMSTYKLKRLASELSDFGGYVGKNVWENRELTIYVSLILLITQQVYRSNITVFDAHLLSYYVDDFVDFIAKLILEN